MCMEIIAALASIIFGGYSTVSQGIQSNRAAKGTEGLMEAQKSMWGAQQRYMSAGESLLRSQAAQNANTAGQQSNIRQAGTSLLTPTPAIPTVETAPTGGITGGGAYDYLPGFYKPQPNVTSWS